MHTVFLGGTFGLVTATLRIVAGGALLACMLVTQTMATGKMYFPPPEAQGDWRSLVPANGAATAAEKRAVLEEAELDWDKLQEVWRFIESSGSANSFLVIRNGWIAAEWDALKRPIAIHSCTKSLTGLAMAKLFDLSDAGQLAKTIGPESFAYVYLPASWGDADPRRKLIRIKHLMTMSSGLYPWDAGSLEGMPRWDYYLTRPVETAPENVWAYNSLGVDLLSLIVENVSGQTLQDFFNQKINAAIGIAPVRWWSPEGHTAGAGGAEFTARRLARVGYLALQKGVWQGSPGSEQVIRPDRISLLTRWAPFLAGTKYSGEASPQRKGTGPSDAHRFYGQLWWTNQAGLGLGPIVAADAFYMSGWGGQLCIVVPSENLVIVRLGKGNEDRVQASSPNQEFQKKLASLVMAAVVRPGGANASTPTAFAQVRTPGQAPPAMAPGLATAQRWDVHEVAFDAADSYANPFMDVSLSATFTHQRSGARLTVDGFHDGGSKWRIRFMPTQLGTWRWTTKSTDRGLDGKTGAVECVAPTKPHLHGPLQTSGLHFVHVDGTPRYLISTRLTCQFAPPSTWPGLIALLKEGRINRVLFMMPGVDSKKDPVNTQRNLFAPGPDYTRYNVDRFRAIDAFIDTLRQADILASPYFYYDPRREILWKMTPEQDRAYIRYGMARMGAFSNVMPVLGNEIELKTTNYKDKAYDLSCNNWINEMGAYLKSRTVFGQPISVHNPCWHELAVNPSYFTLLKDWPFAAWTDFMLKQAQVGCIGAASALSDSVPQPQAVVYNERSYARHNQVLIDLRKFRQPVINEEPAYDMGSKSAYASQTPETMRPTFWTAASAGAYTMWGSKSTYVTGDPLPAMMGSLTVQYMRVHHDVMASLPFAEMEPHNEIVTPADVTLDGAAWRTNFALAQPGEAYLVYSLHGGNGTVTLASGRYAALRIDPRDGSQHELNPVDGGAVNFSMPPGDWVLTFRRLAAANSKSAAGRPWRSLPLVAAGKVDPSWAQVGWGGFSVDGGALRTETDERGMGLLLFRPEKFGDCQIRIVYQCEKPKSNAGIFVRLDDGIVAKIGEKSAPAKRDAQGKMTPDGIQKFKEASEKHLGGWYPVHHGYEVQIMDATDALHRTGAIYSLARAAPVPERPQSEWRTMIITLDGERIAVEVDGKRLSSFDAGAADNPPRKTWTEPIRELKRPTHGYIGLQNHDPGDVVWFKEISVRPLGGSQ
ncbi:MAG: DUF5060 domain-containing protein [Verrucomicrobia bacterium]|nr:DUF5060 domain-containing protein [Verrucomicrobiota bacterium]